MILVFPADDGTNACIAWGKVRGDRYNASMSPITETPYGNGTHKYYFQMNVSAKNTGGSGKKANWVFEDAGVTIWARDYDVRGSKAADVTKLLRQGDMVLVFGKYRTHDWQDGKGVIHTGHDITADIVLPAAWLYDIILALFAQVVLKSAPPRMKEVKKAAVPRQRDPNVPSVTHPAVIDEEDWFT